MPTASGSQRTGARAVDAVVAIVILGITFLLVPGERFVARLFLGVLFIAAYEAAFVLRTGSTPGKVIAGIRVAELDYPSVQATTAIKRGLLVAIASLVLFAAPVLLLALFSTDQSSYAGALTSALVVTALAGGIVASVYGSSLRRSFIDRLCGTFVVVRTAPPIVSTDSLEGLARFAVPPIESRWGPLATFDQRRRGRAARLDDAPVLVVAIVPIVFVAFVPDAPRVVIALLALLWEVAFVADETWRVCRRAGTAGHRRLGLAVVDVDTGEAPGLLASLTRALLVSLPLYVLPAGLLLSLLLRPDHPLAIVPAIICLTLGIGFVLSIRLVPGRGLHDMAAHTEVVAPPGLRPDPREV